MEGAFGSSFAAVRVHTDGEADALSRQMSATAFTVGKDMFFSRGAYRPGDASGERLIAHELAHVEQDATSARRMVHRAVGFEFETNVMVKKRLPNGSFVPYPKASVLKQYDKFRMETDENSVLGSTIEFVVDPPVQEGNEADLTSIMKLMVTDAARIAGSYAGQPAPQDKAAKPTTALDSAGILYGDRDAYFTPVAKVTANPQVTGGIALDRIIDMMSQIGEGRKDGLSEEDKVAAGELEAMSPAAPAKYAGLVKAGGAPAGLAAASKELQGLAALLVSYLRFGAATMGPPLNYAKLLSNSILVRTDFGAIFNQLPHDEWKFLFTHRDAFVTWVLTIAGQQAAADRPVFERGVRLSYDRTSPDYDRTVADPELNISRQDWLTWITKGYDPLSAKSNPQLKDRLEGLGGIGAKFDAVGAEAAKPADAQRRTGVVMEFRNMRKNVDHTRWGALAHGTFDYISRRNA